MRRQTLGAYEGATLSGNDRSIRPARWYQWTLLALCGVVLLALGYLYAWDWLGGPDSSIVLVQGLGMMVCAVTLPLRRSWPYYGAALLLASVGVVIASEIAAWNQAAAIVMTVIGGVLLLLIALLLWLRSVFVAGRTTDVRA